ncbi:unnamed protein product, partial [Allacma fusca]
FGKKFKKYLLKSEANLGIKELLNDKGGLFQLVVILLDGMIIFMMFLICVIYFKMPLMITSLMDLPLHLLIPSVIFQEVFLIHFIFAWFITMSLYCFAGFDYLVAIMEIMDELA